MNVGWLISAWAVTWIGLGAQGVLPFPEPIPIVSLIILAALASVKGPSKPGQTTPEP